MSFRVKVHKPDGTEGFRSFKSQKQLKEELIANFDGQAFWLDGERLAEVPEELQWDWKRLTPLYLNRFVRDTLMPYIFETRVETKIGRLL